MNVSVNMQQRFFSPSKNLTAETNKKSYLGLNCEPVLNK